MINVSSEKILIVDDEKQICTLIKSFLEKEQYSIFTAYDAESALDILNDITPDLIILDVSCGYHGVDLCLLIYKDSVPILFLSCISENSIKSKHYRPGGRYITSLFYRRAYCKSEGASEGETDFVFSPKKVRTYQYEGLDVDLDQHMVFLDGNEINLTQRSLTFWRSDRERKGSIVCISCLKWLEDGQPGR